MIYLAQVSLASFKGPQGKPPNAQSAMGISPVVGRLTLAQEAEVRILDPQPSNGKPFYFCPFLVVVKAGGLRDGSIMGTALGALGAQSERVSPYLVQEPPIRPRGLLRPRL